MINEKKAREYCCEDIRLIRGYERAVNDTTQLYELHHLEGVFYSVDEMKRLGKYFKQPAEALIFLTRSEHKKIHYAFNPVSDERKDRISKAKAKPVFQYTLDGIFMNEWPSIREIVKTLGFGSRNIYTCCIGKCISSYGYIWSYEKKDRLVPMKNEWIKQVGQYTLDGSLEIGRAHV